MINDKINNSTKNMNNSVKDAISLANDITVILKNKLTDYSNQINELSELLYDGLILLKENGDIFFSNTSFLDIFEYSKEELLSKNIQDIIDTSKIGSIDDLYDIVIQKNPNPYELLKGIKNGNTRIYIDISMTKIQRTDKSYYYLCIIRDTTDRVTREKILQEFFDLELTSTVITSDGNILFSSTNFRELYGDMASINEIYDTELIKKIMDDSITEIKDKDKILSTKRITINNHQMIIISIKKAA